MPPPIGLHFGRCLTSFISPSTPTMSTARAAFTSRSSVGRSRRGGRQKFYQVQTATGREERGIRGALQGRRELVPGRRTIGFECTIAVADVDETAKAVLANGGRIVLPKSISGRHRSAVTGERTSTSSATAAATPNGKRRFV